MPAMKVHLEVVDHALQLPAEFRSLILMEETQCCFKRRGKRANFMKLHVLKDFRANSAAFSKSVWDDDFLFLVLPPFFPRGTG